MRRAKAYAALEVGVFGVILVGLCSMFLGTLSRLVSLDPLVFFSSMAGVMVPMVMVVAGALAPWASESLLPERPRGGECDAVLLSLVSGFSVAAGTAMLFLLALALGLEGVFPSDRLWVYFDKFDGYGYVGLAVLLAAYVALAAIGGGLYRTVALSARYKG